MSIHFFFGFEDSEIFFGEVFNSIFGYCTADVFTGTHVSIIKGSGFVLAYVDFAIYEISDTINSEKHNEIKYLRVFQEVGPIRQSAVGDLNGLFEGTHVRVFQLAGSG